MKSLYTYPIEKWNAQKCARISKRFSRDGLGTRNPYPGKIADGASPYPQYGQEVRYNGGTIIDGEHYQSVYRPFPVIPNSFEFYTIPTWGTYIRKKK